MPANVLQAADQMREAAIAQMTTAQSLASSGLDPNSQQVARQEAEAAQQRMAVAQQLVTAAQSADTAMQAAADLPHLSSIM